MFRREWRLFAEDILESLNLIQTYTENMELADFSADRKTIDAVISNFEIIGEASRNIPAEIKSKYSEVDWKGIIGLRNRIAHEYFGVSLEIVWNIIKEEFPRLREQVTDIVENAQNQEPREKA